ncbi:MULTISPECIES: dihydropteroate synthase [Paraburkholderia]|jgi:dihydropteroate synthase|uniref:Dihydropteroate synthase n=1 Tax=Paraburkholderia hospita TaxID=169430 RepID=A0ABN0F6C8_9BURK|nr:MULTISPECIES: dihydropteroate synthase [Paraburkholderia]EUC17520.1 dihydropteroate synthase [Burkholderia sp. BT03]SKC72064.1 Dihydropteroate synthase [Burkholderia sp. CF099]SOE54129.1 Dihydropteroate synthase [Burkholderia sp. YR290]EIM94153.1 dihydropteroate synthase [Paraburkholderia hospita]MDW3655709.1 dihydropteroate synthase [Paraburkholderia terrae]
MQCGRFTFTFERPLVMGILNVTPDSFSDGGLYAEPSKARLQAELMLADGADIIDIGGESTRPGAPPVPLEDELDRVIPLVKELSDAGIPVSVDTYKPEVMRHALAAGADLINDIWGFRMPGAIDAVKDSQCGLCVMHMLGEPQTMQVGEPAYADVVAEIRAFLDERVNTMMSAGVAKNRISVDPGFGFGKTVEHNYALLAHLSQTAPIVGTPLPILAGMSRKSMLGAVVDRPARQRVAASVAAAVCAAERGAAIIRVHDVEQTVDALKVWAATRDAARRA